MRFHDTKRKQMLIFYLIGFSFLTNGNNALNVCHYPFVDDDSLFLSPLAMLNTDSSAKDSQIVIVDMLDDNREKSLGYFDMLRKKEN